MVDTTAKIVLPPPFPDHTQLPESQEERDKTPPRDPSSGGEVQKPGKFWVYEQVMRIPFYGIYEINNAKLEVYHLVDGFYQNLSPNERGHYPIAPLGVELGLWEGSYQNQTQVWLRWWDREGNLLLIGQEQAERERQKRLRLVEQLRSLPPDRLEALGINPEDLAL